TVSLAQVEAEKVTYDDGPFSTTVGGGDSGSDLYSYEQCIEMAQAVMGYKGVRKVKLTGQKNPPCNDRDRGRARAEYPAACTKARSGGLNQKGSKAAAARARREPGPPDTSPLERDYDAPVVKVTFPSKQNMDDFHKALIKINQRA